MISSIISKKLCGKDTASKHSFHESILFIEKTDLFKAIKFSEYCFLITLFAARHQTLSTQLTKTGENNFINRCFSYYNLKHNTGNSLACGFSGFQLYVLGETVAVIVYVRTILISTH